MEKECEQKAQKPLDDKSLMQNWLFTLGLKEHEFSNDGNCLFNALADQLGGDHTRYRWQAVDYMRKNPEFYKHFVPPKQVQKVNSFEAYLG